MPFQGSESEIGNYDDLYVTTTLSQTKLSNPFKKFQYTLIHDHEELLGFTTVQYDSPYFSRSSSTTATLR